MRLLALARTSAAALRSERASFRDADAEEGSTPIMDQSHAIVCAFWMAAFTTTCGSQDDPTARGSAGAAGQNDTTAAGGMMNAGVAHPDGGTQGLGASAGSPVAGGVPGSGAGAHAGAGGNAPGAVGAQADSGTAASSSVGGMTGGRADGRGKATGGTTAAGGGGVGVAGGPSVAGGAGGAAGGTTKWGGMTGAGGAKISGAGGGTTCVPSSPPSAKDSVTLDMATASGAPTYRGSGFIYGIPQDGSQPPNAMLTDIKVTHLRSGGAQIGCPNGGYVNGQYAARWNAVKAYHVKAKAIGATLLVLVHDMWGADAVCKVPRWPGDDGDWTDYTKFLAQLIDDAKANGMTGPDVRWELWNEPDYGAFWGATQAQWLEMWKRGYQQIRAAIPDAVLEGPSLASGVGGWFNAFLDYVKTNNVIPNYLGWHEAGGGGDPVSDGKAARTALSSRGIDVSNLDISEYGSGSEQNPGHSAWFLARLERADLDGLRSNWGGGSGLYATMGGLVTNDWQPNGQWWIYKRYADQSGLRTSVTAGSQVDAVAYQDEGAVKSIVVIGNRGGVTGPVNVVIKNMPAWLQDGGTTTVLVEKIPDGSATVAAPTVVDKASHAVMCNALTITLDWSKATDGYAVTLTP